MNLIYSMKLAKSMGVIFMSKIYLPNGMEAVEARYNDMKIDEYNNNPFIQALPPLKDKETIIRSLILNQPFSVMERTLDSPTRLHLLNRVYNVFQALPIHVKIWEMVNLLIMQGYVARNAFDKDYKRFINESGSKFNNKIYELNSKTSFNTTASCGLIAGFSGMGKTSTINRCLNYIPEVICHNYYNDTHFNQLQLTWLRLEAPTSLKSLVIQFFLKTDEILGTNNFKRYMSKNLSTDALLSLMGIVANNVGLGLLIIDEFQNLNRNGVSQIMNFLTSLINSFGVPILFSGTPACYDIFSNELRIARRVSNGNIIFNNMKNDQEFRLLLNSIWRYQWVRKPVALTENMTNLFYDATQGIIDLVVKLFVNSMRRAIESGKEEITEDIVIRVAKEEFRFVENMLSAIKSENIYKIHQYEDIRRIDKTDNINKKREKIIKRKPAVDDKSEEKKIEKIIKIDDLKDDDLRKLASNGIEKNKSLYEILKENGYIDTMDSWI